MVVLLVVKLRGCAVGYFNDTPDLREEGLRRVVVGYALWKLCPRTAAILQVQVCNIRKPFHSKKEATGKSGFSASCIRGVLAAGNGAPPHCQIR